jgi:uncharacterized protein
MDQISFLDTFRSPWFWSACLSWLIAQGIKTLVRLIRTGLIDFRMFVSTGGMPSAHSALVSGLATSIGLTEGFGTAVFSVSLAFALLTMFDASTVRRAAGMQAALLNEMVAEMFKNHRFSQRKLAELLGHTRLEVFIGMLIGVLTGIGIPSLFA